ncbi:MAG: ABC transporter ATP-binding protein [Bacillota bacterium]
MRYLRILWPYYRPRWLLVAFSLAQIALAALLALAQPQIIRHVVDRVLTEGNWEWLLPGALAVVGAALVQGLLRFGQRYTMESVSQRVIYDLRSTIYRHLQSLSFTFYDKAQTGDLMARVTADVEILRHSLGMGVVNGLMHLGTVAGIIIAMFAMDWRLALASLFFLPFLGHAIARFSLGSQRAAREVQNQNARLSSTIQENIAGVRVVRAFAREEDEVAKFQVENSRFQEANLRLIRLNSFWTNYMNFLTALGAVAVLWYGGRLVMAGQMSVGTLIAFNAYVAQLLNPVRMMGWILAQFTRAAAGLQRIADLLETRSDLVVKPDAITLGRVQGHVVIENVSFGYEDGEPVLDGINLEVQPGQRVAILGLTGSGKSSLVNLIPRFYDPTEGRVLIDGVDVRDVTLESLRQNMAIVLQESFLFSTTLKENIAYGKPNASMEEIIAAAKAAQIHEFINSLPDKYETVVGERGVGLSGGQKQRVAIARAILTDNPILILDESTSAIDVQTEHLIQAAMDRVMQNRTAFVIASRLSTVMNADLVIVMERGRIVERGTHAELIQQDGLYRRIYELQLKPAEEARLARGVAV